MDIVKIQTLIKQGRVVALSDIDPNESYLQIGVYQPNNRKIGPADANAYAPFVIPLSEVGGGGGGTWGTITGLLSNQLDLQAALNSKYDASNPAGYITISALAPYLTSATAATTYLTQVNAIATYQPLLGFTPEDVANKSIDNTLSANSDTLYSSQKAVKTYVDASVTGVLNDRGNWDASSNLFPTTGGSGPGGSILKGDLWYVSVPGILGGTSVVVGNNFRALVDNPTLSTDWNILNVGLGYIPENIANKGIPNGYASLDANGKVPASQLNYKTIMKHGWSGVGTAGAIGAQRWLLFGGALSIPVSTSTVPVSNLTNARQYPVPKTGIITNAKFGWYVSQNLTAALYTVTIRNRTTNTSSVITASFPLGSGLFMRNFNVSGLNIPVTENDEVFTVIECPSLATVPPTNVYMSVDYIIE
jgi:hypothetical protein